MTDEELNAIEARAKAATEGPWRALPCEDWKGHCDGILRPDGLMVVKTDSGCYPPEMPDALFIAHARSDVPALVEEVRRLRRTLEIVRKNHTDRGDRCLWCDKPWPCADYRYTSLAIGEAP